MPLYKGFRASHPQYLCTWSDRDLHAVAMRFNLIREDEELSDRQEWLFDRIVDELEYRRRELLRVDPLNACACALCWTPFPEAGEGSSRSR